MKILFFIFLENKIGSIISFSNINNNNNNIFLTGDKKGNLIQWKIINEKIVLNYYKNVHSNWINNIKIDKYNRIITASEDGLIKIIEII
jgi:WD40 repeat protein